MENLVEWLDDAANAAHEERATVAGYKLFIAGLNSTTHRTNGAIEDHLTLPLYSIAEGLAYCWWNIFGGRDSPVSLTKFRMGYAVPDVRLAFDGQAFEISSNAFSYENPELYFFAGGRESLARSDAESQLSEFIEKILERLNFRKLNATSAALRWERVQESRKDIQEVEFCEAAGALGLDPYSIDDSMAALIERSGSLFSGEAHLEFLAGARHFDTDRLLAWVAAADQRPKSKSRVAELGPIARDAQKAASKRSGESGWSLGYRRAFAARKVMNLSDRDRFGTYKKLASRLGAGSSFELAGDINGLRALRSDHDDGIHLHIRGSGGTASSQASRLFTLARAMGDAVCFPEPAKAAINELRYAYRQSAGRAFAAEFLAPMTEIRSMLKDGHDKLAIADEFGVATDLVDLQIENTPRILALMNAA